MCLLLALSVCSCNVELSYVCHGWWYFILIRFLINSDRVFSSPQYWKLCETRPQKINAAVRKGLDFFHSLLHDGMILLFLLYIIMYGHEILMNALMGNVFLLSMNDGIFNGHRHEKIQKYKNNQKLNKFLL